MVHELADIGEFVIVKPKGIHGRELWDLFKAFDVVVIKDEGFEGGELGEPGVIPKGGRGGGGVEGWWSVSSRQGLRNDCVIGGRIGSMEGGERKGLFGGGWFFQVGVGRGDDSDEDSNLWKHHYSEYICHGFVLRPMVGLAQGKNIGREGRLD